MTTEIRLIIGIFAALVGIIVAMNAYIATGDSVDHRSIKKDMYGASLAAAVVVLVSL